MDRSGRRYTQYKNFKIYTDSVNKNEKLLSAYEKIKTSTRSKNEFEIKINDVVIDEIWVKTIEELLPYVSAAISEDRRFIRNQSETLPVEKTKRVSRETVIDLSVNSQNIRKIKENDEIEPSKLLVVEKLDDYSIYENKFLVYLLKLLKSFIDIRFEKIKEAKSIYENHTKLTDTVNLYRNKIAYSIDITDSRYGDLNLEENDKNIALIKRIRNLEVYINQLMRTDLIEQVSKAPSIRPPVQRTNLLKNDVNFSKALKLYDFISSYAKPGYTITPIVNKKDQLSEDYLDYFSRIPTLIAFLSYAEAKDVYPLYKKEYEVEKEENRIAELEEINRKIHEMFGKDELNKRLVYEFIVGKIHEMFGKDELNKRLVYEFIVGMQEERIILQNRIEEMSKAHKEEVDSLNFSFKKAKEEIINEFISKIDGINKEKAAREKELLHTIDEANEAHQKYVLDVEQEIKQLNLEIEELKGRIKASKIKENEDLDEYELSEEFFNELEKEKIAFDRYFNKKWNNVRKAILKKRKKQAIAEVKEKRNKRKEKK